MKSPICNLLKIDFPLVAFSHCRDVVVEVSKAGGMGVLGAVGLAPDELELELSWIDTHIDGKPYGIDLLVPNVMAGKGEQPTPTDALKQIPGEHTAYADTILRRHGIDADVSEDARAATARFGENMREEGASRLLEVAFAHPIGLVANALGVPPSYMLDRGKAAGVPVAALVGSKEHALRQVAAGVDILVVAGGEAGGHCGDVSTLVLVPEVCAAIKPHTDVPILAAGGIVTGGQMAACMAMGAAGAWTGSVWLTTNEAETSEPVKEKMLAATSRDTIRSKARTGKYSRQLRSAWTDAWEAPDAPSPLAMPLQSMVTEPVLAKVHKLAEGGHEGAKQLATYWVGQGVGLMNNRQSVRAVVAEFMADFVAANARLAGFLDD